MKLLIITSKKEQHCYERIIRNWFQECEIFNIPNKNGIVDEVKYKFSSSKEHCVCIPTCVDPELPEKEKTEIVIDEVEKILSHFRDNLHINIEPSDLYLLLHSGDLFPLGDARRENGLLRLSAFPFEYTDSLKKIISDGNIFQFRHTRNDVTLALMGMEGGDISLLFNRINDIISDAVKDEDF